MPRKSALIITLVLCLAVPLAIMAAALVPGDATGTVVANGKKIPLKFSFARAETEEGERTVTVLLTDKPASRALLSDSNRLQKAIEAGDLQILQLEVAADGTLKQASFRSKQLEHKTIPMMANKIAFTPASRTATTMAAKAKTTEEQTFFNDAVTFDVTFSTAIGEGKYADSPSAVKQITAKAPKLGPGGAAGTLTFDGKTVKLGHAFATTRENPFDEKKQDVVVYLTDSPVDRDMILSRRKMAKAVEGGMRGMVVAIDSTETPIWLEILQPERSLQLSGSGIFNFDPTQADLKNVEGRFYTTAVEDFMDHKYAYDVSFRSPVQEVVDTRMVEVDAKSGTKLPAGGGEPGKAYFTLDKAIRSGNLDQIARLTAKGVDSPLDASPEEQKQVIEMLKMMQPLKVKIVDGWSNAERATLHVTGDDPMEKGKKAKGTIQLVMEDGAWKIVSQKWKG